MSQRESDRGRDRLRGLERNGMEGIERERKWKRETDTQNRESGRNKQM